MPLAIADIITLARDITGNSNQGVGSVFNVPDNAITGMMSRFIRQVNEAIGDGSAVKEVFFPAIAGQQNYDYATFIGTDVDEIEEVLRAGANVPDFDFNSVNAGYFLGLSGFNCLGSFWCRDSAVIPAGLQGDVFQSMVERRRAMVTDLYGGWEEAPGNRLRLMPVPTIAEVIYVKYTSTGASDSALPDRGKEALVLAACYCICDAVLNRFGTDEHLQRQFSRESNFQAMISAYQKQKADYQSRFETELNDL